MTRHWWMQVKAVIRLELRKTFFAKRGLWIYVVAALPVVLYVVYAVATANEQHRTVKLARVSERPLTYQDLRAIKPGMTKEEVIAILGKPPRDHHWIEHLPSGPNSSEEIDHEDFHYSDGQNDLYLGLVAGQVQSINIRESLHLGDDTIMFAGIFQFFFLRLAIFFGCLGEELEDEIGRAHV